MGGVRKDVLHTPGEVAHTSFSDFIIFLLLVLTPTTTLRNVIYTVEQYFTLKTKGSHNMKDRLLEQGHHGDQQLGTPN